MFLSPFYSFAPTLDLWKVVEIKSSGNQKERQRALKSNKNQQKSTKSNNKQKWTAELEKLKRATKDQNQHQKEQNWFKGNQA